MSVGVKERSAVCPGVANRLFPSAVDQTIHTMLDLDYCADKLKNFILFQAQAGAVLTLVRIKLIIWDRKLHICGDRA